MSHIPFAEVPVTHQCLRTDETIVHITAQLENLENVTKGIFQHVKSSVEKRQEVLKKLQQRSESVKTKIENLVGKNKSTKIFASAKYPASEIPQQHSCDLLTKKLPPVKTNSVKITSKPPPFDPESLKELCQHFHIKPKKQMRKNVEVTPQEGLGGLPPDLQHVSGLLLFNTSENVYSNYVMLDPLGMMSKTKVLDEEVISDMDAAPRSMSQEPVGIKGVEAYFYSPTLQEVPNIDVPLHLPYLPGVAGDLQFSMESEQTIAPSGSTSTPKSLPVAFEEIPAGTILPTPPTPLPAEDAVISSVPKAKPEVEVIATPPIPPPPPQAPQLPEEIAPALKPQESSTIIPGEVASASELQESFYTGLHSQQSSTMSFVTGDAHANLMEAIRNAGGKDKAKLRSVIDRKQEAKLLKQDEAVTVTSSGTNLMADLHAKLSLRRKGISGAQTSNMSTLQTMLTLIPPAPTNDSDTEEQEDTDTTDWDD